MSTVGDPRPVKIPEDLWRWAQDYAERKGLPFGSGAATVRRALFQLRRRVEKNKPVESLQEPITETTAYEKPRTKQAETERKSKGAISAPSVRQLNARIAGMAIEEDANEPEQTSPSSGDSEREIAPDEENEGRGFFDRFGPEFTWEDE